MNCLLPFDEFDSLEGIVHLANAEEETEIKHCLNRFSVSRVNANKFTESTTENETGNASLNAQVIFIVNFNLGTTKVKKNGKTMMILHSEGNK